MTTKEAVQAMLDGKKVRTIDWNKECYVLFNGEMFIDEEGKHFSEFTFYGPTWEIYEEPKPKKTVVIEKWLLKMQGTNQYAIEEGSKEEMCTWGKNKIDSWQKVKLLDTYEVEL